MIRSGRFLDLVHIPEPIPWDRRASFYFLLILAIVSFPSTYVFYVAPPISLLLLIRSPGFLRTLFLWIVVLLVCGGVPLIIQTFRGIEISMAAVFYYPITHAMMLLLPLLILHIPKMSEGDWIWFKNVLSVWVFIQAPIGVLQYLVFGEPDGVSGTYGLFDMFGDSITISQVMFTCTVFPVSMVLVLSPKPTLHKVAGLVGFMVCILAQSGHQTIFLVLASAIVVFIQRKRLNLILSTLFLAAILATVLFAVHPSTFKDTEGWFKKTVLNDRSPKRGVAEASIHVLNDPIRLFLGVGPGQFCSRAGLIASGDYLRANLPGFLVDASPYYEEYVDPQIERYKHVGEGSAIAQPFCTFLAIPVEWGLISTVVLLFLIVKLFFRYISYSRKLTGEASNLAFTSATILLTFLLCCVIENYAEFIQGVTIPVIILVLAYRRIKLLESLDHSV